MIFPPINLIFLLLLWLSFILNRLFFSPCSIYLPTLLRVLYLGGPFLGAARGVQPLWFSLPCVNTVRSQRRVSPLLCCHRMRAAACAQSLSPGSLSAAPGTAARQALLSSISPRACSDSCLLRWWCHLTVSPSASPSCVCLQLFPASGSFLQITSVYVVPHQNTLIVVAFIQLFWNQPGKRIANKEEGVLFSILTDTVTVCLIGSWAFVSCEQSSQFQALGMSHCVLCFLRERNAMPKNVQTTAQFHSSHTLIK